MSCESCGCERDNCCRPGAVLLACRLDSGDSDESEARSEGASSGDLPSSTPDSGPGSPDRCMHWPIYSQLTCHLVIMLCRRVWLLPFKTPNAHNLMGSAIQFAEVYPKSME